MWEDPIVSDVRRTREELAARFDFDVKAIFADLRNRQAALGGRLVQPVPSPPGSETDDLSRSPDFGRMIQERRKEQPIPWAEAKKDLATE